MWIDAQGLLQGGKFVASPNCDDRPPGPIELLVIHAISLPPREFGGDDVEKFFLNTLDTTAHPYYAQLDGLKVSAHFFIRRDGQVIQFVPCLKRAWHAGASCWQGRERCNDFSIGIELEGCDDTPYSDAQYIGLVRLTTALRDAYPLRGIAGHSDVAPLRKCDPGPCFDWVRFLSELSGVASQPPLCGTDNPETDAR